MAVMNKEYMGLSGSQKAAAVMISLGAETASSIYKNLRENEVEQVTYEIARLKNLSAETFENILQDFYGICLAQQIIAEGGLDYAREVLEKAFGAPMATQFLEKVTKSLHTKAFEFIRKADYKNLMAIIQNEHPQTIALILSYARSDQASTILAELPNTTKIEVVERIAKMDRTSPEVIKEVEKTLERKFSSIVSTDFTELGGVDYIAEIMNDMDRGSEKYIFDELAKKDAKLTEEIRKRMFVFEDIINLQPRDIQRALREIDAADLSRALKGASPEVQEVFFSNLSKRMSETVRSDMEDTVVRMREMEEAQQKIVAIFRQLEEQGQITIAKGGGDDIVG
ncbi:MAG: flagellar motor switch protein FliG [Gracilibacteraceae bacterium]|jgi:flagellar motor switch protein FliG|nr:flagellar motor switch protein FliG [Gracilibacteraceae bacterium]MDR1322377.1 flagellar motor switch protein FliG [Gracilibacteraceae bacterium]